MNNFSTETVISWISSYRGGQAEEAGVSGWGWWLVEVSVWVAEGTLHLPLGYRQHCCVFSKSQKKIQSTGYDTVIVSSVALLTSLLTSFLGPTNPVVNLFVLAGFAKSHLSKQT